MTAISTITELFSLSKTQYRVYDIGRKIDKISKEQFTKIEQNQVPYPFPSQGHAFIALSFWQKTASSPYLWFVKLPLDERGLLNQGARDHFIAIIIEALGSKLTQTPSEKQEKILEGNPYIFTPPQYKLAALNSKIKVELKQPASHYFIDCQRYIAGELSWDNWQNIGVQGISDFAARINQENHTPLLINALPNIAPEVLLPLCSALENEKLSLPLVNALVKQTELVANSVTTTSALLRSLATSYEHPHVITLITKELKKESISNELLIILSGLCWLIFQDKGLLMLYLEQLIKTHDMALFNAVFKDLVAIPCIRIVLLQCIREPNRSEALAQAIGQLFNPSTSH